MLDGTHTPEHVRNVGAANLGRYGRERTDCRRGCAYRRRVRYLLCEHVGKTRVLNSAQRIVLTR